MEYDLVITRHSGLVDYLREEDLIDEETPVMEHVGPEDVEGLDTIGVLPLHLASEANTHTEVSLDYPPEYRGEELSAEEVREYEDGVTTYAVLSDESPVEVEITGDELSWVFGDINGVPKTFYEVWLDDLRGRRRLGDPNEDE